VLLLHRALQVREDLRDDQRLLDAGIDLELPAAVGAALDLDTERSTRRLRLKVRLLAILPSSSEK
jgi:hypothetical protein